MSWVQRSRIAILFFCLGLLCLSQQPRAYWQSRDSNYNVNIVASTPATTFDPAHHTNSTLSPDKLTVLHSGGGNSDLSAYSIATTTTNQKIYIETHVVQQMGGGGIIGIGVDNTIANRFGGSLSSPTKGAVIVSSGAFFDIDSVDHATGILPSWTAGDNIDIAFNSSAGVLKMWGRLNNGAWNASQGGTQDPATAQGGVTVTNTPSGPWFFLVGQDAIDGDGFTATFSSASFARTPPTGFTQLQ